MDFTEVNSYKEAVDYINDIPRFAAKSTMETTRAFFNFLGCPGENKKIAHIAGTNGKGSVCTYLSAIIKAHGEDFKVGTFTSPHLITERERFKINDEMIDEEEFLDCFFMVAAAIMEFRSLRGTELVPEDVPADYHPSFFEYLFLMGMVWFDFKEVDYIVLETGLGGRLDATNIILSPVVTGITDISFDHCQYLGDTIEAIAKEKAGIIKEGCPVVYADRGNTPAKIIKNKAKKLHSEAFGIKSGDITEVEFNKNSIDFCFNNRYYGVCTPESVKITLPTVATYQPMNASIAFVCSQIVMGDNFDSAVTVNALKSTIWMGRMQEVSKGIYVDGAHNEGGIEAFVNTLDMMEVKNASLVFGVSGDKQYDLMINTLISSGHFNKVYLTSYEGSRSAAPSELVKLIKDCEVEVTDNVTDALAKAKKDNNEVFVVGSLYLVGEVLAIRTEEL